MSKSHHNHEDHLPQEACEVSVPEAAPAPEGEQVRAVEAEEALPPEAAFAAAQEEIKQLKDQILRAMAETENTRRRMKKEIDDTNKYAVASFAREMLAVADNFGRALEAVPKEGADGEALKTLVTGVEATERQLSATLEKFGIKKIEPLNLPFDPHFHRVMMGREDLSRPAGTVLQVLQPGYMIHDRLLREAMVIVSKGGPVAQKVDTEA